MRQTGRMADDTTSLPPPAASAEEIQPDWHELKLKVAQLEAGHAALEQDAKALRSLLERVIEHRQKSHGELVLLLTSLVSKLPINDVGIIVTRLVEHNTHVSETLAALVKGRVEADLSQPALLKALEQAKQNLAAVAKQAVEELLKLETPLEDDMLRSLVAQPERFFSPKVIRASRCFVKGQVPRERIVREFGEAALACFNDMITDPKFPPLYEPTRDCPLIQATQAVTTIRTSEPVRMTSVPTAAAMTAAQRNVLDRSPRLPNRPTRTKTSNGIDAIRVASASFSILGGCPTPRIDVSHTRERVLW